MTRKAYDTYELICNAGEPEMNCTDDEWRTAARAYMDRTGPYDTDETRLRDFIACADKVGFLTVLLQRAKSRA